MSPATNTKRIPLRTRWDVLTGFVLVDAADYAALSQYRWCLSSRGYAVRMDPLPRGGCRHVRMHRELLGLPRTSPLLADHINGNPLDNRRSNLRVATPAENSQNRTNGNGRSRFRGVYWQDKEDRWGAMVSRDGKRHFLGLYYVEHEAAAVASTARSRLMPFSSDARLWPSFCAQTLPC